MTEMVDYGNLRPTPSAGAAKQYANMDKLRAKAEELEGVFLNTLMSEMFNSIDARGSFGGGYAEETWRSMQAEQYAEMMAENGGIGLADQIISTLIDQQEAAQSQFYSSSPAGAYKP